LDLLPKARRRGVGAKLATVIYENRNATRNGLTSDAGDIGGTLPFTDDDGVG
jgi:hypothetical protein